MLFNKNILFFIFLLFLPLSFQAQAAHSFNSYTIQEQEKILQNDHTLTDDQKNQLNDTISKAKELIQRDKALHLQIEDFQDQIKNKDAIVSYLEKQLAQSKKDYAINFKPDVNKSASYISEQILNIQDQQQEAQLELTNANATYLAYQSLPNKAQNIIAQNTQRISQIQDTLSDPNISDFKFSVLNYELQILEEENKLYQDQLNNLPTLQDIENYKILIFSIKAEYYTKYLNFLQKEQNTILSDNILEQDDQNEIKFKDIPQIHDEIEKNKSLALHIDDINKENVQMTQDLQRVNDALIIAKQIERNLSSQIKELNGSFILSRLLNRQQNDIPNIVLSYNLDELIPNYNLWLYDLRVYKDKVLDINDYVNQKIQNNPALNDHKELLLNIIKSQKNLNDQLYLALTKGQSIAVELKVKYNDFKNTTDSINKQINDELFWLASNQPIGGEFFKSFLGQNIRQIYNFTAKLNSADFILKSIPVLIFSCVLLILAFVFYGFKNKFKKLNNTLALKLDKSTDNYWVTPLAILNTIALIIPRVLIFTAIASLITYATITDSSKQFTVIFELFVYVCIFLFLLEVLRKNGLAQRHFSIPPYQVDKLRNMYDRIWICLIPILIVSNITEIDSINISNDIIGYTIVLICLACLLYFISLKIIEKIQVTQTTLLDWTLFLIYIAIPLVLLIMLVLGYYYTAVKLINRLTFSFSIYIFYILIRSTIRRMLFVAEIKLINKSYLEHLNLEEKDKKGSFDFFKFELLNTKAYKIINIILLCITIYLLYLQWQDLAGVLNNLNNIVLYTTKSVVDGKVIISNTFTLANIVAVLIIILIAIILNRNLPTLLERLAMLQVKDGHKSTGYTIKIISSYIIIALAIVFSASAIGISWDNLQWLVAALSVGLGFGLQEIFANFVSGLIILFERQIRVGDIVTLNGLSGTVNKIRIRATTIVSFDNKEVVIPNKEFITSALTNWSLTNSITMIDFLVGVAYDADTQKAKRILSSIVRSCPYLSTEKEPRVYIKSLDASAVTIACEMFVNEISNRKNAYDYLSSETLRRFALANIEIPFNQLDVKIKNLDNGKELNITPN